MVDVLGWIPTGDPPIGCRLIVGTSECYALRVKVGFDERNH